MTAWQYFAGAGLVAALCPLHGHVAVAGDGNGRGARIDLCVPAGQPRPPGGRPSVRPPAPSVVTAGPAGPTGHHPGRSPRPAAPPADRPAARPEPATAPGAGPGAGPGAEDPKPPGSAPGPAAAEPAAEGAAEPVRAGAPAEAAAPPLPAAAVARVSAFHVRPYRAVALERRGPGGMSTVMLMVVVTTPAVLAAAALRPRGKSRR